MPRFADLKSDLAYLHGEEKKAKKSEEENWSISSEVLLSANFLREPKLTLSSVATGCSHSMDDRNLSRPNDGSIPIHLKLGRRILQLRDEV